MLLQLQTGDRKWRHAVVISGTVDNKHHWVLLPSRKKQLASFASDYVRRILPWDGRKLPPKLRRVDCVLDVDSADGVFRKAEIDAAVASISARPSRRARVKAPLPLANSPGAVGGSPVRLPPSPRSPGIPAPEPEGEPRPDGREVRLP